MSDETEHDIPTPRSGGGHTQEVYEKYRAAMAGEITDEMVEAAAKVLEPNIMRRSSEAWKWRQDQGREFARREPTAALKARTHVR